MKAMILSAGFGTRLKPLTNSTPKALIPFRNKPMIEYQIDMLKNAGVDLIVVNTHHLSEKIIEYFNKNKYEINIEIIVEKNILGTGGAIVNAKNYFVNEKFFIVVNVDVFMDFKIKELIDFYIYNNPFAAIAVQKRKSSRYLLFDMSMNLKSRTTDYENTYSYAFNGIHIISSDFYKQNFKCEFSDIIDLYLRSIQNGNTIKGYDIGSSVTFLDLGKLENFNL